MIHDLRGARRRAPYRQAIAVSDTRMRNLPTVLAYSGTILLLGLLTALLISGPGFGG